MLCVGLVLAAASQVHAQASNTSAPGALTTPSDPTTASTPTITSAPAAAGTPPPGGTQQSYIESEGPIVVTSLSHPNTSVRWGRASGVVDASLAEVLDIVEDYGLYHTFLPHFRTSRVLARRGQVAIVYMEALIAMDTITLWAQVKMGPAASAGTTRAIDAKMMKGNVNILEARWELTPIDARHTRVAFQLLIDPKVPLPASLLSDQNAKASRRTISALRKNLALQRTKTAKI